MVHTAPMLLLTAAAAYAGFQWTVHVVVYRQFSAVPPAAFGEYERLHQRRISYVVGPLFVALIAAAGPLGVTFHRAFDMSRDPETALEDIIALGCERVLTSGAQADAPSGAALIAKLVAQAAGRISVMPGAGVNARNILALRAQTGAREFHASAKRELPSRMRAGNDLAGMTAGEVLSDVEQVRALVAALAGDRSR